MTVLFYFSACLSKISIYFTENILFIVVLGSEFHNFKKYTFSQQQERIPLTVFYSKS